jgi:hypothetical protein
MIVLTLIDDPPNRLRRLRIDPPGGPRYITGGVVDYTVCDGHPCQFQVLVNDALRHLESTGVAVDDDHPPQLHLTRAQADWIAATREYRLYLLGAPDALNADTRQYQLNEQARASLPMRMETGDWYYGLPVVIEDEEESDTPVVVGT